MRFYCIGDQDTVAGFRFAGVEGRVVESPAEARTALRDAAAMDDIAVIIVPQKIAAELDAEINEIRFTRAQPTIVEIPGPDGPAPGRPQLLDLIREAIGVRV